MELQIKSVSKQYRNGHWGLKDFNLLLARRREPFYGMELIPPVTLTPCEEYWAIYRKILVSIRI